MYRDDDRRAKEYGTHLENATRVRFTEAEDAEIERLAAMYTAGRKAPWIRRCTLLGQKILQVRHERLLASLIEGRPLSEEEQRAFEHLLASMIEQEVINLEQAI